MRLSKNFMLSEFLQSQYADRHNINMEPPQYVVDNLNFLVNTAAQPIRALLNRSIIVTSGYRPPELNNAIGGSVRSAHVHGLAFDFIVRVKDMYKIAKKIAESNIVFDQLLFEHRWIHVGVSKGHNRQQIKTVEFKKPRNIWHKGIVKI